MLFKFAVSKPFFISLFFISLSMTFKASGQRFYSVVFDKLPQNYQLYPRNDRNEANVPISGLIEVSGYSYMSIVVRRDNKLVTYLKAPISYGVNGAGRFSTATTIKAELANYSFDVYACKTRDSVLMVKREKVVSGDAVVIMGQSNSTSGFAEPETSDFCRTFGIITGTLNIEPYNVADTLWSLSNTSYQTNVGTMGLEIQKQLVQQSGVPICLINAGFHWSSAYLHSIRNETNPMDLNTGYGRMLYRVTKAGVKGVTKAFIYRQGESEAYHEAADWSKYFDVFYGNLKKDLTALQKLYVFQIDVIYYPSLTGAILRDYQRRLPDIYPDVRNLSTVGTKEFDGIHYGRSGYVQGGYEVSRLINRDLYRSKDTVNIDAPNIKKVLYRTSEKKEVVLVFDEEQQLIYPESYKSNANVTLEMKDFFYLNDKQGLVNLATAEGNRVVLKLNAAPDGNFINYLPPFVEEGGSFYPYTGPYVKNERGMRAFTFYHVPIVDALSTPSLVAKQKDQGIELAWSAVSGATHYQIERKKSADSRWTKLVTLASDKLSFSDGTVEAGSLYNFRVKGTSSISESGVYGFADAKIEIVTDMERQKAIPLFVVYPNPVKAGSLITVQFSKPVKGNLAVYDLVGRKVYESALVAPSDKIEFESINLRPNGYLIRFDSEQVKGARKLVIIE